MGGAVFAMKGSTLLMNVSFSGNTTTAGIGTSETRPAEDGYEDGSTAANDVFICTEAVCGSGNAATVNACGITSTSETAGGTFGSACSISVVLDTDALSYTENGEATQISPTASVSGGSDSFDGGTLTAQITVNAESADQLSIIETGGISLSGDSVLADGVTVGTASAASVTGGTVLTLTFNSSASLTHVESILQAIGYDNTSDNPGTSDRTVTFVVTDAAGNSNSGTRNIGVSAVNDAPTDITLSNYSVDENMPVNTVVGTLSTTDSDG